MHPLVTSPVNVWQAPGECASRRGCTSSDLVCCVLSSGELLAAAASIASTAADVRVPVMPAALPGALLAAAAELASRVICVVVLAA